MTTRLSGLILLLLTLALPSCTSLATAALLRPNHRQLGVPGTLVELGEGQVGFYLERGPGELAGLVLCFHGNGGRAEYQLFHSLDLMEEAADGWPRRLGFLSVEYPGYGRASGEADFPSLTATARRAYAYLRRRAGDLPILIHGRSMGTVPSLNLASTIPAAEPVGLILEKPPVLFDQILWQHGWWNLFLLSLPAAFGVPDCADSCALADQATGHPALFIVCADDVVTPPRYGRRLAARYRGPVQLLESAGAHHHLITPERCPELRSGMAWLLGEVSLGLGSLGQSSLGRAAEERRSPPDQASAQPSINRRRALR